MKIFNDIELIFSDLYAQKPAKTLKINTTAPVQVQNNISPCSGGVATFSQNETYSDRFIVWRAIGQKLYLEERSICRTVLNGSLCIDFGRTSIVPGTCIKIEKCLLSLIVPTQSGVHRFTARLVPDPMDELNVDVKSLLSQINDRDFLGENHSSVMLTTSGEVKKAKVLTDVSRTMVAYCMLDGKLVLISMPASKKEKSDEVVLKDGGLFSKLIGSAAAEFVCDADGNVTHRGETLFYALYKDMSLKVWTVTDSRTSTTIQLSKLLPGINFQESQMFIRVNEVKDRIIIVLAIRCADRTSFHCFVDHGGSISTFYSTNANFKGKLVDFQLMYHNSAQVYLYALWRSSETSGAHTVAYTLINESNRRTGWSLVHNYFAKPNDYSGMSSEELKEYIFNSDRRAFDIVLRAVQITCDGSTCEVAQNDWKALNSHVENYMRYPDNPQKYQERIKIQRQSSSKENENLFEKKFLLELLYNCDQLEEVNRVPLSLFIVDVEGADLAGVILKECFSIVCPASYRIEGNMETTLDELASNLSETTKAEDERKVKKILSMIGEDVGDKCCSLVGKILDTIDFQQQKPANIVSFPFRGQFTAGLVAAIFRQYVENYLEFTGSMLRLRKVLKSADINCFDGSNMEKLEKLDFFQWGLEFIKKIFDIKMQLKFTTITLGSWIFLANDLSTLRCEGSAEANTVQTEKMNYNWFVETTVRAVLRALWPSSTSLTVCRLLAEHFKWSTLYKVCQEYLLIPAFPSACAIQYYLALSFSGSNHPNKALNAFYNCFSGVENNEEALLRALRPAGASMTPTVTLGEVYAYVIKLLSEQNHSEEVIMLSKKAIELLPDDDQFKNKIYTTLFNLLVKKGIWHEALETIKKNRDPDMKRMTLLEFVNRLLKARDWKTVISLHYGVLEQQVEHIIVTAARAQEIETSPHLFELLYSYYMTKSRFNKAAQIMLEYSYYLKLTTQNRDVLKRRRDVLATVCAIFELIDKKDRFAYFPQEQMVEEEVALVPDDMEVDTPLNTSHVVKKRTTLIIDEKAVRSEWIIAKARLVILADGMTPPIYEQEILKQLIQDKHYDEAFDVCREFSLDPSDLFFALTSDSILLDLSKHADFPLWAQNNRRHVGKSVGNNWSILKGLLAASRRTWPEDSRSYRAITTSFLSHDFGVPCWLQMEYSDFDIADYSRCLVDFNQIEAAADCLTSYLKNEIEKISDVDVRTILPYAVINDVLHCAKEVENSQEIIKPLNKCLQQYFTRISAFESAQQYGSR